MGTITLTESQFVHTRDYLSAKPGRGKAVQLSELGYHGYIISNVICAGTNFSTVGVISPHGQIEYLLKESDHRVDSNIIQRGQDFWNALSKLPVHMVDEAAPLYGAGKYADNLFHWMIEYLPKVLLLEKVGYTGNYILNQDTPFAHQSLRLLGIEESRLLPMDHSYSVGKVFLTDPIFHNSYFLQILRTKMLDTVGTEPGSRRCFIHRTGTRRIINEEKLLKAMEQFDFEVLTPEELSLYEQIRFLSNSELTFSPHGAGTMLSLFQKPNSILMETFGRTYTSHCYGVIVRLLELLYMPVSEVSRYDYAEKVIVSEDTKHQNYHVDIPLICTMLENAVKFSRS